MSQKRENGTGTIYQRENGSWVGKIYIGYKEDGKPKFKYFSGKSESEVKKKIREYNKSGSKIEVRKISVGTYLYDWLKTYKRGTVKESSYDALEKTIRNQIVPELGMIQLQQLTSRDIQTFLTKLKEEKHYSHSTIKKSYDCLNAVLKHAVIKEDIEKNPMLLVNMSDKRLFETKQIRFFTQKECALIIEESSRKYSTGKPVYVYGDAYILMLNTGIRMGEAIGLKKSDWDKSKNTLHIQRNVQSVMKRDNDGERTRGKQLVCNTTKTYSGDRLLPLNVNATEAIERLCEAHPNSEYIVCSSTGEMVPPERLERTFYRMLKNIGIEQAGTHSLRHTFASFLFAKGVDIKTVSMLLGHASIQITLNTYVHLIGKTTHTAVAKLDKLF